MDEQCMNCGHSFDLHHLRNGLCSQCEEDEMLVSHYMESESFQNVSIDELNKCADYILKKKMTPNLDFPE